MNETWIIVGWKEAPKQSTMWSYPCPNCGVLHGGGGAGSGGRTKKWPIWMRVVA